jgi:hypothetical protein
MKMNGITINIQNGEPLTEPLSVNNPPTKKDQPTHLINVVEIIQSEPHIHQWMESAVAAEQKRTIKIILNVVKISQLQALEHALEQIANMQLN